jgi:hypothetical protein
VGTRSPARTARLGAAKATGARALGRDEQARGDRVEAAFAQVGDQRVECREHPVDALHAHLPRDQLGELRRFARDQPVGGDERVRRLDSVADAQDAGSRMRSQAGSEGANAAIAATAIAASSTMPAAIRAPNSPR